MLLKFFKRGFERRGAKAEARRREAEIGRRMELLRSTQAPAREMARSKRAA